jgi:dihydrofolate synthase/folylpolyglutamate synthase
MLENKDAGAMIERFAPIAASLTAIPVPGHPHHPPVELTRLASTHGIATVDVASDPAAALRGIAGRSDPRGTPPVVLILGSLYLAGMALEANDELPD